MAKFIVGDRELETRPLRGRDGRVVTNYLLKKSSTGEIDGVINIIEDPVFLDRYLPIILGAEDAKYTDENATSAELLEMITKIVEEMTAKLGEKEVATALKN